MPQPNKNGNNQDALRGAGKLKIVLRSQNLGSKLTSSGSEELGFLIKDLLKGLVQRKGLVSFEFLLISKPRVPAAAAS